MKRPLSAGSTVETQCTRCRAVMNHTIVAMVGEKIARVECNTCHGIHNYHPVKLVKAPAATKSGQKKEATPRKAKVDPTATAATAWVELMAKMDPSQATPYDMNGMYRVNSVLLHPQFGLGIVQTALQNKIEVLFEIGTKRLRCG